MRVVMKIHIGISDDERLKISNGLGRVLADTFILYLTTHSFHWNVTGPYFNSLHNMFMDQYTELWNAVDPLAERIRALGYPAPGSFDQFAKLSSLQHPPSVPPAAKDMLIMLCQGHEGVIASIRSVYTIIRETNDEASADLLTQRLAVHEQTLWMLRAQLEGV